MPPPPAHKAVWRHCRFQHPSKAKAKSQSKSHSHMRLKRKPTTTRGQGRSKVKGSRIVASFKRYQAFKDQASGNKARRQLSKWSQDRGYLALQVATVGNFAGGFCIIFVCTPRYQSGQVLSHDAAKARENRYACRLTVCTTQQLMLGFDEKVWFSQLLVEGNYSESQYVLCSAIAFKCSVTNGPYGRFWIAACP